MVTKIGFQVALGALLILGLSACSRSGSGSESSSSPSQIAAQVNDKEISIHQVQAMIEFQPVLSKQFGDKAYEKALDSLIEQELASQAARTAGLEQSPKVVQALELAKREVLARAYQDQLAAKVALPDESAVSAYFDAHPELFAQRQQYVLQELVVKAEPTQLTGLQERIASLGSVSELNALVSQSGLPHSVKNGTYWAESLPMDVLPQLAKRKPGQSLVVAKPEGLLILTVVSTESAPVSLVQVRGAIRDALLTQSRKDALRKGMESLRQQAKISKATSPASSAPR